MSDTPPTCPYCGAEVGQAWRNSWKCGSYQSGNRVRMSDYCEERTAHAATSKALEAARKWALSREDDITKAREELDDVRKDLAEMTSIAEELGTQLTELLRVYCLVQRCEIGHPCPENISTLQPMYAALSRLEAEKKGIQ